MLPTHKKNRSVQAERFFLTASSSGATGKALDSLLGNITDQQLSEGRNRLGTYRAALAADVDPANDDGVGGHVSQPLRAAA